MNSYEYYIEYIYIWSKVFNIILMWSKYEYNIEYVVNIICKHHTAGLPKFRRKPEKTSGLCVAFVGEPSASCSGLPHIAAEARQHLVDKESDGLSLCSGSFHGHNIGYTWHGYTYNLRGPTDITRLVLYPIIYKLIPYIPLLPLSYHTIISH